MTQTRRADGAPSGDGSALSPPGAAWWARHRHGGGQGRNGAELPGSETRLAEDEPPRLVCARCATSISDRSMLFVAAGTSERAVFANPQGRVFEIVTLRQAENLLPVTRATSEFSWFAGYAWRIVICAGCQLHLGWSFEGSAGGALPALFYGLIAANLVDEAMDRN